MSALAEHYSIGRKLLNSQVEGANQPTCRTNRNRRSFRN